jgi:hypothetical protein
VPVVDVVTSDLIVVETDEGYQSVMLQVDQASGL